MTTTPTERAAPRGAHDLVHDPNAGLYARCPCHQPGADGERGWHQRKGPLPILAALHGQDARWWHPRWADHPYRVRLPDRSWAWVAEPYSLNPDAFPDLAHLEQFGFSVAITSWRARHYPGHTLAITITERRKP